MASSARIEKARPDVAPRDGLIGCGVGGNGVEIRRIECCCNVRRLVDVMSVEIANPMFSGFLTQLSAWNILMIYTWGAVANRNIEPLLISG
jgi:hypothetical protein